MLKSMPSFKSVNVSLALTRRAWSVLLSYCHTGRIESDLVNLGVHCTHGFNRCGYFICAYLCRVLGQRSVGSCPSLLTRGIFVYLLIQVLSKRSIPLLKHDSQASTNRSIWIVYKRNLVDKHRKRSVHLVDQTGVSVGDHPSSFG